MYPIRGSLAPGLPLACPQTLPPPVPCTRARRWLRTRPCSTNMDSRRIVTRHRMPAPSKATTSSRRIIGAECGSTSAMGASAFSDSYRRRPRRATRPHRMLPARARGAARGPRLPPARTLRRRDALRGHPGDPGGKRSHDGPRNDCKRPARRLGRHVQGHGSRRIRAAPGRRVRAVPRREGRGALRLRASAATPAPRARPPPGWRFPAATAVEKPRLPVAIDRYAAAALWTLLWKRVGDGNPVGLAERSDHLDGGDDLTVRGAQHEGDACQIEARLVRSLSRPRRRPSACQRRRPTPECRGQEVSEGSDRVMPGKAASHSLVASSSRRAESDAADEGAVHFAGSQQDGHVAATEGKGVAQCGSNATPPGPFRHTSMVTSGSRGSAPSVAGTTPLSMARAANTASVAPAAPRRCPV